MESLTPGQCTVLALSALPMAVVGAVGGWGTYTNIEAEFHRSATAAGAVAAGEGVTLVLALVMLALTLLGQPSPLAVRAGLWLAPVAASVMSVVVADSATEAVVYALTPLAMCGAAEGIGLLARRVVIYSSGVNVEAMRRNASVVRRIAYHHARAERHPWKWVRRRSGLKAWRLMALAGRDDVELGAELGHVQRARLTSGAGVALEGMLGATPLLQPLQSECDTIPDLPLPTATGVAELDAHVDEALDLVAPDAAVVATLQRLDPEPVAAVAPELDAAVAEALQCVAADDTVALLSVADVARLKGVTPGTVRSWVSRDKLTPHTRDADGRLWFHPAAVAEMD